MRVRLNGWQRIGIVLSVAWALAGAVLGGNEVTHLANAEYDMGALKYDLNSRRRDDCISESVNKYNSCNRSSSLGKQWCASPEKECDVIDDACEAALRKEKEICVDKQVDEDKADLESASKYFSKTQEENRFLIPLYSLAPIPFAWLIVYTLIGLWRWIRRGFNT